MSVTRRTALELTGIGLASLTLAPAAQAQNVNMDALMQPNLLGERVQGKSDAAVTVIEYASLTCGHCAHFHTTTYPKLKSTYIETGKVKLMFREFPLNYVDFIAYKLVRSLPEEQYFAALETFYQQQESWAFTRDPEKALRGMAKQIGFSDAKFDEIVNDQVMAKTFTAAREHAIKQIGIESTPTFFINGKRANGALSFEDMDKIIAPLIKS